MSPVGHVLPQGVEALEAALETSPGCEVEGLWPGHNQPCPQAATIRVWAAHTGDASMHCQPVVLLLCDRHFGQLVDQVKRQSPGRCLTCRERIAGVRGVVREWMRL